MCKVQMLRALVNRRLTAAVEEIFGVLERTIAEYEDELSRTKEENERQRQQLDAAFKKPQDELHREDICEKDIPPKQQEWSGRVEQEEPQPPHIKKENKEPPYNINVEMEPLPPYIKKEEKAPQPPYDKHVYIKQEEEDHSISQEGEHLEGLEEFPVIVVPVKSEDDEDKGESEEKREVEPPSSSSTQHMTTEADGDHCGGSQANNHLAPLSDSDDTTSHSPDTDDEGSKADMSCHTDNTRFKCSQCDKTFGHKKNLNRHMRYHTGEKPFMCSFCCKGFYEKAHLITHTRIHTGEKPFSCSICGLCFVRSQNLKMHMRRHTGEKPFSCSVCGTGFVQNQDLKKHMRRHTGEKPFTCSVCGMGFVRNEHLKIHMRRHTGEKPYSCPSCNKSFCDRTPLVRHMRTHTGEKVFSCSVCGERFSYKYQLNNHKCAGENSSNK